MHSNHIEMNHPWNLNPSEISPSCNRNLEKTQVSNSQCIQDIFVSQLEPEHSNSSQTLDF